MNMHMKIVGALIALALAPAAAGCGGSSGSTASSGKAIQEAEHAEQSQGSIEQELTTKLGIASEHFSVGAEGECSIAVVVTGSQVSEYEGSSWTVFAPDGSAAVKITPTTPTPPSECMVAVADALGWGGGD